MRRHRIAQPGRRTSRRVRSSAPLTPGMARPPIGVRRRAVRSDAFTMVTAIQGEDLGRLTELPLHPTHLRPWSATSQARRSAKKKKKSHLRAYAPWPTGSFRTGVTAVDWRKSPARCSRRLKSNRACVLLGGVLIKPSGVAGVRGGLPTSADGVRTGAIPRSFSARPRLLGLRLRCVSTPLAALLRGGPSSGSSRGFPSSCGPPRARTRAS